MEVRAEIRTQNGVRPEYDFEVIGNNLKRIRKENHFSVEQVRNYLQLGSVQSIYKWERGESLPQADSLIALLDLYGVKDLHQLVVEESQELSSSVFYVRF